MATLCRLRSLVGFRKLVCSVSPLYPIRSYSSSLFGRIGFIGLGNMGSRMADSLIKAGYEVAVHDINHNVMKLFSDKGILTEDSPLKVAETSDVVITMLPSSNHVLDVYTGQNGFLSGGNPLRPWLFIDSSTIDPQTSRKVSAAMSNCSLIDKRDGWKAPAILDAPVSGGVLAAENGTLTFMVGGSEEAYAAAKPLFLSMGENTIYCGGSGNGATAKICNNLAMAISMLGVSEAFALGQSLGIAASTLTQIFNSSSARCWSSDTYNPVPGVMDGVPSSRNYIGGFASKLMAKDLNLAAASAKDIGFKCPLTSQAEKMEYISFEMPKWSENIDHLAYADIFNSADTKSLQLTVQTLEEYEKQSGQMIHKGKSSFYVHHKTANTTIQKIEDCTSFTIASQSSAIMVMRQRISLVYSATITLERMSSNPLS